MKRIEYKHNLSDFTGSSDYLSHDTLLLDIETTGLSPKTASIYMIGTGRLIGDELCVTLLFAETFDQEEAVITCFLNELSGFSEVITFNGERFDLPFIRERARKYGILTDNMDALRSIDLLLNIRPFKKLLGLSSCRQKAIEALFHVDRDDEYDGGALIDVYMRYQNDPGPQAEKLLLLHNAEDITGMVHILPMLSYSKLTSCNTSLASAEWDPEEGQLLVRLDTDAALPHPATINESLCYIILEQNKIRAALSVYSGTLKYFFPYPAKYVYLTGEQTVVPKLLASAIPSSEKRPAKAAECFTPVEGDFIALDPVIWRKNASFFENDKIFRKDYDKKDVLYIKTDRTALDAKSLQSYIGLLINHYIR